MKIIPVLLNPTIDQIYEIENFYVGGTFKVKNSIIYPVGKAISFSLGIRELSSDETILKVIACIGRDDIRLYASFLASRNIDFQFIEIKGKTRSNKTINDPIKSTTTHIREKGFQLEEKDLSMLKDLLHINIEQGDMILFSGSIPLNVEDTIYFELINISKSQKGITVLDTSGQALVEGVNANPKIIKPNLVELSQIINEPTLNEIDFSNINEACLQIVNKAKKLLNKELEVILITLGEKGAILLTESRAFYGNIQLDDVIDTVGSGDAFLSGFILNYCLKKDISECFKAAIACGAANTLIPGPGIFNKKTVNKIIKRVEIIKIF